VAFGLALGDVERMAERTHQFGEFQGLHWHDLYRQCSACAGAGPAERSAAIKIRPYLFYPLR
jgi:hypothetical protein